MLMNVGSLQDNNLGNYLYFCLRLYNSLHVEKVYKEEENDEWLQMFPKLKQYSSPSCSDSFLIFSKHQEVIRWQDIEVFTKEYLKETIDLWEIERKDDLVLDIRKKEVGSFQTDFEWVTYVKEALKQMDTSQVEQIGIVSDDPDWCRVHLVFLEAIADVYYYNDNPFENFLVISKAPRLIASNTAFSYWGGYANQVLHPKPVIMVPQLSSDQVNEVPEFFKPEPWKLIRSPAIASDVTVSVVMPVYKAGEYVKSAINSVLGQTNPNFEYIIVTDGSDEQTLTCIESYDDPRITVIRNDQNRGVAYAMNKALICSRGDFIMRVDADDISHPERLDYQLRFMKEHPEVDIVAGSLVIFNQDDEEKTQVFLNRSLLDEEVTREKLDEKASHVKTCSIVTCPVYQPTVMIRKEKLIADNLFYDLSYEVAEDYEFWCRLLSVGAIFYFLDEELVLYRWHGNNISGKKAQVIQKYNNQIRQTIFDRYEIGYSYEDLNDLNRLSQMQEISKPEFLWALYQRILDSDLKDDIDADHLRGIFLSLGLKQNNTYEEKRSIHGS